MDSNTQLLNLKEKPMKKFLIRREMEGAGSIPKHELNNAGKGSEEVLEAMRPRARTSCKSKAMSLAMLFFAFTIRIAKI